jgi:hypothetical protein
MFRPTVSFIEKNYFIDYKMELVSKTAYFRLKHIITFILQYVYN